MKVTDLIITKTENGKTYQARIEAVSSETINIALPGYTTVGMNGKMRRSTIAATSTTTRQSIEAIIVSISKEEALQHWQTALATYGENIGKRCEAQSDNVTIVRL